LRVRIEGEVTFLRQSALLLPSAFLLGVLLFLLTHPHNDPGFGNYPFFDQWAGSRVAAASPELRFLLQSLLFFLPGYVVSLLFLLGIVLAEAALFGRREARPLSRYARAFGPAFAVLFLVASAVIVFEGERAATRLAPGALVAPVLVGLAPFAAAALAALPAALVAAPLAAVQPRDPA
jgi:hypothetical protein